MHWRRYLGLFTLNLRYQLDEWIRGLQLTFTCPPTHCYPLPGRDSPPPWLWEEIKLDWLNTNTGACLISSFLQCRCLCWSWESRWWIWCQMSTFTFLPVMTLHERTWNHVDRSLHHYSWWHLCMCVCAGCFALVGLKSVAHLVCISIQFALLTVCGQSRRGGSHIVRAIDVRSWWSWAATPQLGIVKGCASPAQGTSRFRKGVKSTALVKPTLGLSFTVLCSAYCVVESMHESLFCVHISFTPFFLLFFLHHVLWPSVEFPPTETSFMSPALVEKKPNKSGAVNFDVIVLWCDPWWGSSKHALFSFPAFIDGNIRFLHHM